MLAFSVLLLHLLFLIINHLHMYDEISVYKYTSLARIVYFLEPTSDSYLVSAVS